MVTDTPPLPLLLSPLPLSQYLYTLVIKDEEKANKLKQSLPPGLQKQELPKKA